MGNLYIHILKELRKCFQQTSLFSVRNGKYENNSYVAI